MKKKGQMEDFVADFIPSLVIIAIGLYILSNMQSVNKEAIDEKGALLKEALEEQSMIEDNLLKTIDFDNKKISLLELISLSYKNEEYWEKGNYEIRKMQGQEIKFEGFYSEILCLRAEISYPDGSVRNIGEECGGEDKTFALPTYDGSYLTLKLDLGSTLGTGAPGV